SELSRRSQWPASSHGCQESAPAGTPVSAPHSSISTRWVASEREIAHTKAAHRAAASSGVAQGSWARVRVGTDTNMEAGYPLAPRQTQRNIPLSRAGTHIHHTQQYGIVRAPSGVTRREL